jgi:hypothetical protein
VVVVVVVVCVCVCWGGVLGKTQQLLKRMVNAYVEKKVDSSGQLCPTQPLTGSACIMSRRCMTACQLANHSRGGCRHHTAGNINSKLLAIEVAHKAPASVPTQPTHTPNL